MSKDHSKLKAIFELLQPGLVFADNAERFAPALAAVGATATPIEALLEHDHGARADEAFAAIGPDTIAKILFTSGSTGTPKGVINTQRMLCSNQQSFAQTWPFLEDAPPVMCEWLPWNHTFGGNGTFNVVLRNGGTLYIDGGKPMPDLDCDHGTQPARRLADALLQRPRGYDLLLPLLESDEQLSQSFFSGSTGCSTPAPPCRRTSTIAFARPCLRAKRPDAHAVGMGLHRDRTALDLVHFVVDRPANLGNPVPGVELKLVPSGSKLEVRVRGPNVTPGYCRSPELTHAAFDEEGFYRIGDAVRLVDSEDPSRGLAFDGRVAEDFKLQSGAWVHAGAIRVRLIAACNPLVQDAVITGHDRADVGALVWVNPAAARTLGLDEAGVFARLQAGLASLHAVTTGGSTAPTRLLVLDQPPSIDDGEITDKGYVNQRAVLERRAAHVDRLHAGGRGVIWPH